MSVFKRNGVGRYYIQFNFNGRTYCRSSKSTNKRTAERMEREWRDEIHRIDELGERPRITLREAFKNIVAEKKRVGNAVYINTNVKTVSERMNIDRYIDEIRDWDLAKFKTQREQEGIAQQTIKHNFQAIRNAITWAKSHGYLVKELNYPKVKLPKHRLRYLSHEEENRLLVELSPQRPRPYRPDYEHRPAEENRAYQDNYDLVVLLLDSGARYGEIANIGWDSIDLEKGIISLWRPKVRNESSVHMTSRTKEILKRRSENMHSPIHVFTNKAGQKRGYQAKGIRAAFKRANIAGATIHTLRHTFASRLIQAGIPLYTVASILGHTDISTTQIYAHLEPDVSKKALDVLDSLQLEQAGVGS